MELTQHFLTENDCYRSGRTIKPQGIMVHSLGVAQPDINVFLRTWNVPGVEKCVHAFVNREGVVQTLPWDHRGWHAGGTRNGGTSANNTHIGFEICEPKGHTYDGGTMVGYDVEKNAAYFSDVYDHAVELCALLCEKFGFDPMKQIVCHSEGYRIDIASNHADVMHWFPKHKKSMDTFRADVKARLTGEEEDTLTQEQFNDMFAKAMGAYAAQTEENPASAWAQAAWEKATAAGVFDGTKPQAPLTREQSALVLDRLELLEQKT